MPLPPIGSTPSYSVTTGPTSPYSGTLEETFDAGDTLDLARTGGTLLNNSTGFANRPVGSTGSFLYVGPNGQSTSTIQFAQGVHYYGFLWGTPDPNPSSPANRQGVELYSGNELVATYTADSLGLNWEARYVNFLAAQDKPFTRAVLFSHSNFETDNHAVYTAAPAPPPAPPPAPSAVVVDFEEFATGNQNTNVLTSQGFQFTGALSYFGQPSDNLWVQQDDYPSKTLHTGNWFADVTLTKADGSAFDLQSFDFGPDMYSYPGDNTFSDALVTGYLAGGGTVTTTFSDSLAQTQPNGQKTLATLNLNWQNLSAVKIDWSAGTSGAYGTLDNFRLTTGGTPPNLGADLVQNGSFEVDDIATGTFQIRNVTAWTGVTGQQLELHDSLHVPLSGSTGPQYVELHNGGISQVLNTAAGKTYQLDFAYRYGNDGTDQSNAIEVWFEGSKVADLNPMQGQPWQNATFSLTATGNAGALQLRMKSGQEAGEGAFVDAVRVREILPPGQPPTVSAPASLTVTEDVSSPIVFTGTPFADPGGATQPPPTFGSNLLVNGSFEADDIPTGSWEWRNLTGWSGITATPSELQDSFSTPLSPSTGPQYVELANGGVRQSVSTAAGTPYQLDFAYRYGNDGTAQSNAFEVWLGGQKIADVNPVLGQAWQNATYTLTGSGGAANLEFRMKPGQEGAEGAFIDGVQLRQVTTPPPQPGNGPLTVTLTVEDGSITGQAGTGITVGGSATARTFSGTVSDLNAYFTAPGKISYTTAADANGTRTLTTTVSNGTLSANATTTLNIGAVNDAPLLSAPGPQTVDENAVLVFSTANGNALSLSDVDAGTSPVELQLSATNGILQMARTSGLTLVAGSDGSSTMTWRGQVSDLQAALAGMRYTPTRDYNGSASLTLAVSDLGNTGAGGTLGASRTVAITVNPTDSAPTVDVPGSFRVVEDRPSPLVFTGTPFGDADSTLLTVTLSVADGTLTGASGNGITQGGTATARTFTGTVANLNAYFTRPGSIAYTTAPNNTAPRTLTTTASDGVLSTQATSLILIDPQPPEPPQPPRPRPPVERPPAGWDSPPPTPTGVTSFERSVGPMSTDRRRPTETFEPGVVRSLEVSGGVMAGPTAAYNLTTAAVRDPGNHRMVVGNVTEAPDARRMSVDVSARNTRSLGFDWGSSKADQSVELYSGNRLLARYGASEVFADAPEGTTPSAYVTFRTLDGTPITRAVISSSSPVEVDNVSTDPTDAYGMPAPETVTPGRVLNVRIGAPGQPGMTQGVSALRAQPMVRAAGVIGAAAAATEITGGGVPQLPATSSPIVVPPLAASRVSSLYGVPPPPPPEAVLEHQEIQLRARMMSAYALLAPASNVEREALERAYGMRL